MRVLEVADRPGWAIDRLSKPIAEKYDNVDMSYFNVSPERYLASGYSDWKTSTGFTQELGEQYDVIHFHRIKACLFDLKKMKAKKIITIHTERHADWEDPRLKEFDLVIAPTKHAAEHCLKTFPELEGKVKHIPHGIDLERYSPMGIEPAEKEIGYVGRVVKWKRWEKLQKATHTVGLVLNGCGYIEDGEEFNQHNFLEGQDFKFSNFLPEKIMRTFYGKMNLFVCLSTPNIEAGPLPILEAMACGIPVISTRVGWAVDYCEHNKNIIFIDEDTAENTKKLSEELLRVYKDEELRKELSKNGLELIKNFSLDRYCENLMQEYDKLVK